MPQSNLTVASTQNNTHGQYRVEFNFEETGIFSVDARYNGDKEVVPFMVNEQTPGKTYFLAIYNSEGGVDCVP